MAMESVRTALQIVSGAGELTRAKALEAAGALLALPGVGPQAERATVVAAQVTSLADELVSAAAANREMVRDLVRQELATQLKKVGLSTNADRLAAREEIERLKAEVADLRSSLSNRARDSAASPAPPAPRAGVKRSAVKKAAAQAPAQKATAKKAVAKKATAKKAPAKKTTAKKAPAKTTAKKAAAKKAPAKKTTAKKTTAKKATS